MTEQDKNQLYKLKRTLTKIKWEDIEKTKNLLDYYGIKHIQAIGEADKLCASLVIKNENQEVIKNNMLYKVFIYIFISVYMFTKTVKFALQIKTLLDTWHTEWCHLLL